MPRREFVLQGDELRKHKNKVCGKTCESHKEGTSKDKHLHLGHKHWIDSFLQEKLAKGRIPFLSVSVKYYLCYY